LPELKKERKVPCTSFRKKRTLNSKRESTRCRAEEEHWPEGQGVYTAIRMVQIIMQHRLTPTAANANFLGSSLAKPTPAKPMEAPKSPRPR
jgi:hypothetical protein